MIRIKGNSDVKKVLCNILLLTAFLVSSQGLAAKEKKTKANSGPIKISAAVYAGDVSALMYIAKENRLFEKYGLEVNLKPFKAGRFAADALLKGDSDVATVGEFVMVTNGFTRNDIRLLACISKFQLNYLIARKDSGINLVQDLAGKKIGILKYGCRFFGYSQEELVGQDVMTIVPNVERSSGRDLAHLVRDIVVNPSLYTNVSSENIKKSGETVWVTWTNKAVFDESGKINEILAIGNDITRLKQTEAELEALNENLEGMVAERTALAQKRLTQLQALTQELIKAEESERRRLSDLLHEDIQQLLVSTRIHMETACHRGPANHGMEDALKILTKSIKKLKNLSRELSPPVLNHASLSSALEWLVNETEEQYGLSVVLSINTQLKAGEKQINTFLFRTVQELLFNIIKHAGVNEACIDLDPSHGGFTITVTDKGRGFDCEDWANVSAGNGFGLLRINERAQSLGVTVSIESNQGKGSKIKLTVPDEIFSEQPRQHVANSRTI
nr:PAS domain S-box protein [uncultured Desulfobacter sp.]